MSRRRAGRITPLWCPYSVKLACWLLSGELGGEAWGGSYRSKAQNALTQ
jgi:hypothetical protein